MASSAKDIQLRELKDTVSQLKTMVSEQTELTRSLRLMIDEKSKHEDLFKGLPVEKVMIPLPEEDQICPFCGTQMILNGEDGHQALFLLDTYPPVLYRRCSQREAAASREGKTCSGGFLSVA